MGQVESYIFGKGEQDSSKNVNAELQSGDAELVDTDMESRFKKIMMNFNLAEHNHKDQYLGNVDVYRCLHNKNFRIYLKDMFTKSEEELYQQMEMWEKRMNQLQHPNLIQLHACCSSKIESFCATFYKIFMIFDSVETDLLSSIRKEKIGKFQEDELWFLLDSLVGALEYMEERELTHQSLRLDTIYVTINHKNIKLYKLADCQLMGYESNYERQLQSFDKYIYLSPILYQQYGNQIQIPQNYNPYKSDVFTLGLLFMHISLFESCADLYSQIDFTINAQALQDKIYRLSSLYSSDFVKIIAEMCELDERLRPDFRALDRKLSSYPQLFGHRICEIVQVPNLYKMKPASFMTEQEIEKKKEAESKKKQYQQEKEKQQQELSEKDIIIKAIQQQDALNIIKESLAKTSYITDQLFRQSQRADVQFQVDNLMLNPSARATTNENNQYAIPQMNFIDQQHQIMLPQNTQQGIYIENQLQQTAAIQSNKQLNNYDIPFNNTSPTKSRPPAAAGHVSNNLNNLNNYNNINSQNNIYNKNKLNHLDQQALDNFGAQIENSQFGQQISQYQHNDMEHQQNNENKYNSPLKNQGGNKGINSGSANQAEIMLTSTSKQLYTENPELPKIIKQNLLRQTIKYKDGSVYEGDILDGNRHGYGVFKFTNQQKYEGEWKNNKRHGKGTQYFQNGQVKYEGQWSEDLYDGFGSLFNKNAKAFQLSQQQIDQFQQKVQPGMSQQQILQLYQLHLKEIQDNLFQDLSLLQDTWVKYEGDFNTGRKEGFGTITYSNQDYFVGQFVNGQACGSGNYMYADATHFVAGEWQNQKIIKRY